MTHVVGQPRFRQGGSGDAFVLAVLLGLVDQARDRRQDLLEAGKDGGLKSYNFV